jgi:hypothetical protein
VRAANQTARAVLPYWPRWMTALGLAALLVRPLSYGSAGLVAASAVLVGCILAAVHHAEIVAHRAGEPFGTLILALAVTVIEASLILSMVLNGSAEPKARWPRYRGSDRLAGKVAIITGADSGIVCLQARWTSMSKSLMRVAFWTAAYSPFFPPNLL